MELHFQTKEESNRKQLEDFLKLSKTERFYHFLRLMEKVNQFPVKRKNDINSNFIIQIKAS
ncbi:hypothetical protein [Flavobacterium sp.]|uniref:hypothetical protein n=1 Tax=Flavobacterium sp. XS2P14 TaxID=3401735 RepID=UPI00286ABEE8|nr:hypothetical protein [Flavobacterium sp.]